VDGSLDFDGHVGCAFGVFYIWLRGVSCWVAMDLLDPCDCKCGGGYGAESPRVTWHLELRQLMAGNNN